MVTLKLKKLAFHPEHVQRAMDPVKREAAYKAGSFIRTKARQSIKSRKGISKPGKPPHSHTRILKDLIYFKADSAGESVIVGPVAHGKGEAPSLLEFGGTVVRKVYPPAFSKGGRPRRVRMTYRPRPFMGPAMATGLQEAHAKTGNPIIKAWMESQ